MSVGRSELGRLFLPKEALSELFRALHDGGYSVVAPSRADGVVGLQPIQSVTEIASGVSDEQSPGRYRLLEGHPEIYFDYVVGPDSPKRYLFPPRQELFTLHNKGDQLEIDEWPADPPRMAFLGIRPCELAAIQVQDRVFEADAAEHPHRCASEHFYRRARERALLIVVNCTRPGGTCFCASMGSGPEARAGYDLAMTELSKGFVMDVGSDAGRRIVEQLSVRRPSSAEVELAELKLDRAKEHMGRQLDTEGLHDAVFKTIESRRFNETAKRCLSCGNCTQVCPTCFCSTVVDESELMDQHVTRVRQWESCFTHQFSYTTSGPVRNTVAARYRHWLRHKLCTWNDQFGTSGCVGCGRCITWCPAGIDITEEASALRASHDAEEATSKSGSEVKS